jgi:ubiquinone/menaquinone biosynthesis C-methylase UbiE
VRDGSVSAAYCSHVLEHLPRDDLPAALYNTLRILKPGGVFRLVVPDLYWRASVYVSSSKKTDPSAADQLMSDCLLGKRTKPKTILAFVRDYCGNSAHLWMYDFAALEALLREAGFTAIRRCEFGDAKDPMFARVEDRGRFFEGDQYELAIEAMKPIDRLTTDSKTSLREPN